VLASIIMVLLVDCLFVTTFGVVMVRIISSSLLLENIVSNKSEAVVNVIITALSVATL
jgi:hypothetical protein